jgi:cytochrome c biogenesis protein ResB
MNKFRREVMWAALTFIVLLTVFSIYGAFIGAERAEAFFNRIPLAVYWAAFALLLIVAMNVFPRLIRVPGLLLMHAGCILVLAGGMWGSRAGHEFQKRFLGIEKIRTGRMLIYEGHSDNKVYLGENQYKELPFSIGLKDFRMEYYEPAHLEIEIAENQSKRIPAEVGEEFDLGDELGRAKIVRAFENFKMSIEEGKRVAFDDPRPGSNPALEIEMTDPNGQVTTQYVFSLMPGFGHTQSKVKLTYNRPANRAISDYVSELEVVKDGQVVAEKDIEVNHPLYFGGYHFYQVDYDHQAGQFTVLSVQSDTGLKLVFIGYWALCIGILWHLWLRHIFARIKSKSK